MTAPKPSRFRSTNRRSERRPGRRVSRHMPHGTRICKTQSTSLIHFAIPHCPPSYLLQQNIDISCLCVGLLKNRRSQSRGNFDWSKSHFSPQLPESPVRRQDREDTENHGCESGYHVWIVGFILGIVRASSWRKMFERLTMRVSTVDLALISSRTDLS
jgi:hypothetical protein